MSVLIIIFWIVVSVGLARGLFKIGARAVRAVIDMSTTISVVVLLVGGIAFYPEWSNALWGEDFSLSETSSDLLEDWAKQIRTFDNIWMENTSDELSDTPPLPAIPDLETKDAFVELEKHTPGSISPPPSEPPTTPKHTVHEYIQAFPERSADNPPEDTSCTAPFPYGHWVIAESFYSDPENAYERMQDLVDAGLLNVDFFDTKCYDTDIGSRNGSPRLFVVTIGPTWETEVEVLEFAAEVIKAVKPLNFKIKNTRPVYLGSK